MPTYHINWLDRSHAVSTDDISDLDLVATSPRSYHLLSDHTSYQIEVAEVCHVEKTMTLIVNGQEHHLTIQDEVDTLVEEMGLEIGTDQQGGDVYAPMPGLVLDVLVEPGQTVEEGTPLLVLEAMKMENVIKSTGDNTVSTVDCNKGDAVDKGRLLISMED